MDALDWSMYAMVIFGLLCAVCVMPEAIYRHIFKKISTEIPERTRTWIWRGHLIGIGFLALCFLCGLIRVGLPSFLDKDTWVGSLPNTPKWILFIVGIVISEALFIMLEFLCYIFCLTPPDDGEIRLYSGASSAT